jgi:hypothetical protein
MAKMKARLRRRRRVYYYEPPAQKKQGTPRLAAIQLEGVFGAASAKPTTFRGVGRVGAFIALGAAAAIAGASWIGGSLFDLREAAAMMADRAALGMGLRVKNIDVVGARGARAEEVRSLVAPNERVSLFAATPAALKERVESLDWVDDERDSRVWPTT